jgi:hypothetical protein
MKFCTNLTLVIVLRRYSVLRQYRMGVYILQAEPLPGGFFLDDDDAEPLPEPLPVPAALVVAPISPMYYGSDSDIEHIFEGVPPEMIAAEKKSNEKRKQLKRIRDGRDDVE